MINWLCPHYASALCSHLFKECLLLRNIIWGIETDQNKVWGVCCSAKKINLPQLPFSNFSTSWRLYCFVPWLQKICPPHSASQNGLWLFITIGGRNVPFDYEAIRKLSLFNTLTLRVTTLICINLNQSYWACRTIFRELCQNYLHTYEL